VAKNPPDDKSKDDPSKPAPDELRRAYGVRSLSQLLPPVTRTAYKRRSPASALLMSDWASIVGPHLAAQTAPRRLSGTQLTISCSGPMAMELAHLSAALIERINTASGKRIVERLRFVQDFAGLPTPPAPAPPGIAPPPIEDLPPGALNDALARLRAAMRSQAER
jgi:hypothetical protein